MQDMTLWDEPKNTLPELLDGIRELLKDAQDNWERLKVRDDAEKLKTIALVYERKDLAVEFSKLMMDAEREIAKASEPQQGKRTDLQLVAPGATSLNKSTLSRIRKAHSLDDIVYEQVKKNADEPLTRATLINIAKKTERDKKKLKETKQVVSKPKEEKPKEPEYTPEDYKRIMAEKDTFIAELRAEIRTLETEVLNLRTRNAELEEWLGVTQRKTQTTINQPISG